MEEPGRLQSMGSLELDTTERLHFHALEKEMATHSSVLAWKTPWTEKLGRIVVHRVTKSWTRLKRLSGHTHVIKDISRG